MFKDTSKNIRDIAQELNVGYVLEGSVRKAGNKLRIAAQLIDAAIDAHIWAETYDGFLEDVFAIQENVSQSIVTTLKLKLTPEEKQKICEKPIENVTAYECYLRAYHEILGFSAASLDRAVRYLQDSLDIIGDNAVIYSTMAYVY
jgi:non-specific serine/threonine protein kinase